jgi:hypothetical protein
VVHTRITVQKEMEEVRLLLHELAGAKQPSSPVEGRG